MNNETRRPIPAHPMTPTSGENSLLRSAGISEEDIAKGTLASHVDVANAVTHLHNKQRSFLQRMFQDRKLSKVLEDQKISSIQAYGDYQRAVFKLATDAKLEMAHSHCLGMVRELKVGNQTRFSRVVLDAHEDLRRTVEAKRAGFLDEIDAAFANAERYSHREWLVQRAMESLQRETIQFFDWVDQLLGDFIDISTQRLDEYRKAESNGSRPPTVPPSGPNMWSV